MGSFSDVVKKELQAQGIPVASLAAAIGFSDKYVYDLLKCRNGSRWNEDSMNKACVFLKLEMQFKDIEDDGKESDCSNESQGTGSG